MQYRPTIVASAAQRQATTAWFCQTCGNISNDPGCCCGDTSPVEQYTEVDPEPQFDCPRCLGKTPGLSTGCIHCGCGELYPAAI